MGKQRATAGVRHITAAGDGASLAPEWSHAQSPVCPEGGLRHAYRRHTSQTDKATDSPCSMWGGGKTNRNGFRDKEKEGETRYSSRKRREAREKGQFREGVKKRIEELRPMTGHRENLCLSSSFVMKSFYC